MCPVIVTSSHRSCHQCSVGGVQRWSLSNNFILSPAVSSFVVVSAVVKSSVENNWLQAELDEGRRGGGWGRSFRRLSSLHCPWSLCVPGREWTQNGREPKLNYKYFRTESKVHLLYRAGQQDTWNIKRRTFFNPQRQAPPSTCDGASLYTVFVVPGTNATWDKPI